MQIDRPTLSLAAEYAVASELCRRGVYTQLTLGNLKRTDLLVLAEDGNVVRVEVKAKQGRDWPACKGVNGEHSVLVLVDFQNKRPFVRPDFYILNSKNWRSLIKKKKESFGKKMKINEDNIPIFPKQSGGTPYKGVSVYVEDVSKFKDKWDKVRKIIGNI